jgi:hypothetical protein
MTSSGMLSHMMPTTRSGQSASERVKISAILGLCSQDRWGRTEAGRYCNVASGRGLASPGWNFSKIVRGGALEGSTGTPKGITGTASRGRVAR